MRKVRKFVHPQSDFNKCVCGYIDRWLLIYIRDTCPCAHNLQFNEKRDILLYLFSDYFIWAFISNKLTAENIVYIRMHMTPQQELEFQAATECHICEQSFKSGQKKVRDHNHLIPENNFRGAACEGCNVNYQDTHTIPVVFHNLSGYDAHFVVTDIATRMDGKIDLLPITKEKYISFTKHIDESRVSFRFIDSFRFMASGLDKLSSALTEFPNLKAQFSTLPADQFNLLTKKGVMPYDYLDSFDRFEEPTLPPQDDFYNKLEDKPCPRKMYRRAQEVWDRFNCSNLGQYVDLYMKTDILLLADVFEQFRSSCISTYDLDPAHYFTLPGFTWDAMLKYTRQELELLTDQDMFLFVERGIRGGLSQVCSKRRAHANNKYMPKYDSTKPDVYLMYNDINNQYGWSMSQYLPYGGFEWVDSNIDITTIPDDADEGYILEVDLEYPQHLHDAHTDLPFSQGAVIVFGPLQTAYERELRTYLIQKYGSEHVAILRGRGAIPGSIKVEEALFRGKRFQVYKDLELQHTYWVFYN
ncbi:hypothetical protein PPYR_08897 [Photinus pyralis]|uniref:DNA-directed DNA polymerase n=1 Tax=Photinus pyralis TaxID=7054 RepID=A0A5N4AKR7_PHOPY|nr:hypothetical protein PPYR_08897 [Photinus pyralis]